MAVYLFTVQVNLLSSPPPCGVSSYGPRSARLAEESPQVGCATVVCSFLVLRESGDGCILSKLLKSYITLIRPVFKRRSCCHRPFLSLPPSCYKPTSITCPAERYYIACGSRRTFNSDLACLTDIYLLASRISFSRHTHTSLVAQSQQTQTTICLGIGSLIQDEAG